MAPADPPPTDPPDDAAEDLGVLCPNCAFGNVPEVDFCHRCGAPLSTMATIDPLRSTLAEGFVYRRAADGSPRPIVLAGVWLIFLPPLMWPMLRAADGQVHSTFEMVWVGLIALFSAVVLYRATVGFVRKRRDARAEPEEA